MPRLHARSVTDFRVSAKSDSRVTFDVQRAHPNRCQLLGRRMQPSRRLALTRRSVRYDDEKRERLFPPRARAVTEITQICS